MMSPRSYSRPVTRAVYPGTFDPFTAGHRDVVERARRLFDHLTVLVAVNAGKRPGPAPAVRAAAIEASLPAHWSGVTVATWTGLTVAYCRSNEIGVIVRGVRNRTDVLHEYELAVLNQELGITTLFLPARPALAAVSSTAARSLLS